MISTNMWYSCICPQCGMPCNAQGTPFLSFVFSSLLYNMCNCGREEGGEGGGSEGEAVRRQRTICWDTKVLYKLLFSGFDAQHAGFLILPLRHRTQLTVTLESATPSILLEHSVSQHSTAALHVQC